MVKLTNLDGKWSEPIGRLMISFAHIERDLIKFLLSVSKDHYLKHVTKLRFRQRIDLLIELLDQYKNKSDFVREVVATLNSIVKISEMRNKIAHNPLILELTASIESPVNEYIANPINGESRITYEELQKVVIECELLQQLFSQQTLNITFELVKIKLA